jgi:two-component system phosphate regulon sensor histidine kinase PhoR
VARPRSDTAKARAAERTIPLATPPRAAEGTRRPRRVKLDVRQVALLVAPAGVALVVWWLLDDVTPWAPLVGLGLAAGTATVLAQRVGRRLDQLRDWVARVAAGERLSGPLVTDEPDAIDALAADLGEMTDGFRREIARLANERDELEAILAAMVEGVIVLDRHGTVLRTNVRALETLGIALDRAPEGYRLWDISRDAELNGVVRDALGSRMPASREVMLRGRIDRFLRVTVGPVPDGSAWVLVFHDVTNTKRLERVRTDFVANVSHELRTPLTAIKGFAETLLGSGFENREQALRFVSIIDRQAERLSRLIDDLLTLSDLELGRTAIQAVPVSLEAVVREVADLLADPARRGEVEVDIEVPGGLRVLGDADRLAQVASNLLDNAIKYTPAGGRVRISAQRGPGSPTVELIVADTGRGIPAEDLPRVAERFYRVDKARSRELGGTGLGLAIVKHIVQAHGGQLKIESRLGAGTTVRVSLPAAPDKR